MHFEFQDEKTGQKGNLKINKPMETLFEGVDTDEYFETKDMDDDIKKLKNYLIKLIMIGTFYLLVIGYKVVWVKIEKILVC